MIRTCRALKTLNAVVFVLDSYACAGRLRDSEKVRVVEQIKMQNRCIRCIHCAPNRPMGT